VPAHDQPKETIQAAGAAIRRHLSDLIDTYPLDDASALDRLIESRYERFRAIGSWREESGG
jgi:hypothetical protein